MHLNIYLYIQASGRSMDSKKQGVQACSQLLSQLFKDANWVTTQNLSTIPAQGNCSQATMNPKELTQDASEWTCADGFGYIDSGFQCSK